MRQDSFVSILVRIDFKVEFALFFNDLLFSGYGSLYSPILLNTVLTTLQNTYRRDSGQMLAIEHPEVQSYSNV